MEEKTKRVVTRIGDIFCVEIDDKYKAYFQYIAKDWEQLNSTVIRVFRKRYPIEYNPTMEEIVNDEVSFYAHTVLRPGLHFGTWYKVGKSKNVGDTENIFFRCYPDVNYGFNGQNKSYNWYVWKINHKYEKIGEMTDQYRHYHFGCIFPYFDIAARIRTGKYMLKMLD
jgi:hypothetical protein